MLPGWEGVVFLLFSAGITVGYNYLAYSNPTYLSQPSLLVSYTDSASSSILVSAVIGVMIFFQNRIYREENRLAEEQKEEIKALNLAQNRFFSSMSHEIRTPINTIIGLNEMILREDISDEIAEDAQNIQGASKMLLTLINDILDLSKIESGKMDIIPVEYETGAFFSDIVNMIWVRAKEKGLEFHLSIDPSMPSMLCGDEVRIKQVLINLLNNSVKYTKEGSITLTVSCQPLAPNRVAVSYEITDTGMGIKKESIPHLFEAFQRVDEKENRYIEGTGLGLSIVKQLIDLMGGEIKVNSVYTKGSTFLVTLEQEIIDSKEMGEVRLESKIHRGDRETYKERFAAPEARILVVDDNEINLLVAKKLLSNTQVQVDTATSGVECLKLTQNTAYDGILMDHLMPEWRGKPWIPSENWHKSTVTLSGSTSKRRPQRYPVTAGRIPLACCLCEKNQKAGRPMGEFFTSNVYGTVWALLPPAVAILLAFVVKEAYSSLFIGLLVGALFLTHFSPVATLDVVVNDGFIAALASNAGIFLFLVLLGSIVALVNASGGSAAFGRWAGKHINSRIGAMLATLGLGVLIFVDDYFNCLTVGSVMLPITDRNKVSRAKLSYLIDATAAPICMIAPVSSWTAAIFGVASDLNTGVSGIELFVRAIPYNFYSLLTLVFVVGLSVMDFDYGPMLACEQEARLTGVTEGSEEENGDKKQGHVLNLLLPVLVLIVSCIISMIYVGGFFGVDAAGSTEYAWDFLAAFGNTDAFIALPWGALITLMFTVVYTDR